MAASMWMAKLENIVKGEQQNESEITEISNGVCNGELKLLELIELLGPYLTSKENDIRGRSTLLLAKTIHQLPRNKLSADEAGLLTAFFCDRLKDHHSVTPHTIYGILSLSTLSSLAAGDAVKICTNVFKEVQVQSLVQTDRQSVYSIINNFLYSRLEELQELGSEFVYGFIQVMDGEKDPRNLLTAFQIVQTLIQHFPIGIFAEELFEVTSCYFPIDFRPPPNDPHGISTDSLIQGLRGCLAGTPKFAEFCLPLLMEKLASELQSAKIDAFETLAACAPVYGAKHLKDYLEAVWSYCRKEVFQSFSGELEQAALGSLCCFLKAVSDDRSEEGAVFSLDYFLDEILKECQKHINEPDLRFLHPSCRLLQAVASSTEAVCSKILSYIIPLLLQQFDKHLQANMRQNILSVLQAFIRVSMQFPYNDFPNPVSLHKDRALTVFISVLSETNNSLKSVAAVGLGLLVETKGLLAESEVVLIADHLTKTLLSEGDKDLRQESERSLTYLSTHYPSVTEQTVLPALLMNLSTEPMEVGSGDSQKVAAVSHHTILSSMAALATKPILVESIVEKLLKHLELLCTANDASKTDECVATCQSLLSIVTKTTTDPTNLQFLYQHLLPALLSRLVIAACTERSEVKCTQMLCNEEVVVLVAAIVRNAVQFLEASSASELCGQYIEIFHRQNLSSLQQTDSLPADVMFNPLQINSPEPQHQLVILLTACICSVRREVTIPDQSEVLTKLLQMATGCDCEVIRSTAAKCLAGLVNKHTAGADLDQTIRVCKEHILSKLNQLGNEDCRQRALGAWIWLTKSLLLRSHPTFKEFAAHLIDLFEDEVLGLTAAKGFFVILDETEDVLNLASHADVKLMYRQRFFLYLLPNIIDGHGKTTPEKKTNYLQALSNLLHFVPRQVLLSELPPLMPLLVQSLRQENGALCLSVLERLETLTHDAPSIISEYVNSLLPELLRLAGDKPSMKVRISALRCIGEFTTLPHHIVFPYQSQVIRGLVPRLDDKKRVVRKEAVRSRNLWMMLGSDSK
ncbi:MMS19 nucleotide excision repair protein homolog isoform X2 [Asterias rubens]|nr:MMS19 nucleotide excision repair protein homolog isoform X2 [Asterias rubens]